jgi:hypothetical protein
MQTLHDLEVRAADGLFATRGTELSVDSDGPAIRRLLATVAVFPTSLAAPHTSRARDLDRMLADLSDAVAMFCGSRGTFLRGMSDVVDMMQARRERLQEALSKHQAACADVLRSDAAQVRCRNLSSGSFVVKCVLLRCIAVRST